MKIERKYMAHYLNTVFAGDTGTAAYVRLGKDLEEYSPELSANVEKKSNIMGETSVTIDSVSTPCAPNPAIRGRTGRRRPGPRD